MALMEIEGSVGWVDGRKPNTPTVINSHCIKHSSYEMLLAQYRDRPPNKGDRVQQLLGDRMWPGHGETNIFIVTDNWWMPCPYIILAIAFMLLGDRMASRYK